MTVEELGLMKARDVLEQLDVREDVIKAFTQAYFRGQRLEDVERGDGGSSVNGSRMELITPRRVGDRGGR